LVVYSLCDYLLGYRLYKVWSKVDDGRGWFTRMDGWMMLCHRWLGVWKDTDRDGGKDGRCSNVLMRLQLLSTWLHYVQTALYMTSCAVRYGTIRCSAVWCSSNSSSFCNSREVASIPSTIFHPFVFFILVYSFWIGCEWLELTSIQLSLTKATYNTFSPAPCFRQPRCGNAGTLQLLDQEKGRKTHELIVSDMAATRAGTTISRRPFGSVYRLF
jgi:hypothetical protein